MMENGTYFSYLLRMWRVLRDDEFVWMASLDDPHTGKRRSFSSLEEMYAFLSQHIHEANRLDQSQTGKQNDPGAPLEKKEE
jgi:hypothetical protein